MRTNPVEHKFGKPIPYPVNFGIIKEYHKTRYGDYTSGIYKGKKIEIFNDFQYDQKLQYVSDSITLKWVKSKLMYIQNGIKKIMRSEAK